MDAKADDPPRVLVHHYQHPMASQDRRLAPEQVDAPQAILRMPQERQPGRTTRVGGRSRVRSEHSAHHVLVDVDRKGARDRLCDPRTAPPGVAPLHVDEGILTSALDGPWGPVRRRVGENSQRYLRVRRARWNSRIVDGLSTIAERITRAGRMNSAHTPARIRSDAQRFGARCRERFRMSSCCLTKTDSATTARSQAAGAHQPGQGGDQVHQQDDRVAHRNILATTPRITKLDNLNGLRAE